MKEVSQASLSVIRKRAMPVAQCHAGEPGSMAHQASRSPGKLNWRTSSSETVDEVKTIMTDEMEVLSVGHVIWPAPLR